MPVRSIVVLFTRDLRVHDNPALAAAARDADRVLPLFVLDDALLAVSERRAAQLRASLDALDVALRRRGSGLFVRRGDSVVEVVRAAREAGADQVYLAADVSAGAQRREARLRAELSVGAFPGVTVVPAGALVPGTGQASAPACYRVFTPYHRAWLAAPWRALEPPPPALPPPPVAPEPLLRAAAEAGGEPVARARLESWLAAGDDAYAATRDDLAADATSRLSEALHFGLISPLEVALRSRSDELVRQLAWRDFYAQLLAAYPWSAARDLHPRERDWQDDPDSLAAWQAGLTGYPVVDAGMRELAATGFMHNRARLIVASFLTKDLNIDWRAGAAHFSRLLADGDVASNTGNWQWVAGTGVDTRPGRIFNPTLQARRYDPSGDYVRRWVPELAAIPGGDVHEPWKLGPLLTGGYPPPIVDHAEAAAAFRRR